jgi:hypothetical protein
MTTEVPTKAFLVRPSVSVWTARKLDKDAGESTARTAGADEKAAVKVYKSLVACDELEAVKQLDTKIRSMHERRTVPWHYKGPGAITAAGFPAYLEEFETLQAEFNRAAEAFCVRYGGAREAASSHLGGLFNESDYPTVDVIRAKFSATLSCEPMPDSNDFRVVGLSDKHLNAIKADMQSRFDGALKSAQSEMWDRIVERVEKLMTKLRGYQSSDESATGKTEGTFRDTLVANVQELVNLLPSLNVTNDPALTDIATKMQRDLCQYSPKVLREDGGKREDVATAAQAILAEIWAKRRAARGEQTAA